MLHDCLNQKSLLRSSRVFGHPSPAAPHATDAVNSMRALVERPQTLLATRERSS
jgi:hypothetical protein